MFAEESLCCPRGSDFSIGYTAKLDHVSIIMQNMPGMCYQVADGWDCGWLLRGNSPPTSTDSQASFSRD